jgi:hypothetical protein
VLQTLRRLQASHGGSAASAPARVQRQSNTLDPGGAAVLHLAEPQGRAAAPPERSGGTSTQLPAAGSVRYVCRA